MRRLVNFLVLLGVGLGLITSICYAQNTASFNSKLISVDFKEADLKDVIGILSLMTGLNIALDDDVEGRVTARLENVPVLQALQTILEINDCQYEILDNIIKVTKIPILTQSFTLKYALASEVAELIRPLLSPEGSLKVSELTNTLVISDKGINLEKIEEAIQEIDSPSRQLDTKVFSFEFIRADKAASLIQDQLSEVGKVEIVLPTNSLQVTDTSYNLTKLEYLVSSLDVFQPIKKTFTLKFALASEAAELISDYLNSEDKIEINEEKNEIILISSSYTLERIEDYLEDLDVLEKQISKERFFVKYLYFEELADLVRENLSSEGEMELNEARDMLIVTDASYNLFKLGKVIEEEDIFTPQEKTYEIKFASLSSLAERAEDFLSEEGVIKIEEELSSFVVVDVEKNLEKIDNLVRKVDNLEAQLTIKKYSLRYLTPQEAKYHLQNIISEYGQIRLPEVEKEGAGSVEDEKDYIIIPQEKIDSSEEEAQESEVDPEEIDLEEIEENVIYITDLKKNISNLNQAIEEINGPSKAAEIIVKTFYIEGGSLERIAIAIANIIGVNPEDIQGIKVGEETEWIKMKVTSPTIDLGDIGAVGKK
ncbi:hypothetical protein KAV79_02270 [Candidatus Aerophobetes bacterium]|nr:hypothetical protein [Candidatus Aerophobetes bacterium]